MRRRLRARLVRFGLGYGLVFDGVVLREVLFGWWLGDGGEVQENSRLVGSLVLVSHEEKEDWLACRLEFLVVGKEFLEQERLNCPSPKGRL